MISTLRRAGLLVSLIAAACLFPAGSPAQQKTPVAAADTILIHAKVYTVNEKQPWAEAVAIHRDKILAVGSNSEIEAYRGKSTMVIEVGGRLLLPGFEDC